MSSLLGNVVKGFLPCSEFCSEFYYMSSRRCYLWYPVVSFLAVLALLCIGRTILGRLPLLGWFLIEVWIVSAISMVALATYGLIWLAVNASRFIVLTGRPKKRPLAWWLGHSYIPGASLD